MNKIVEQLRAWAKTPQILGGLSRSEAARTKGVE